MEAQYMEIMENENEVYNITERYQPYTRNQNDVRARLEWNGHLRNYLEKEFDEILEEDVEDMERYYTEDMDREEVTFPEELLSPAAYLSQIEELPMVITEHEETVTMEGIEQIKVSKKLDPEE
ncbi:17448_t:CDS:2 [Acaulospora morrowiae]|uniref:17448_t:CDS:1 n=1 Tax=Acaulospora morrowiae TaxID=94023 RepID=A0A9N9BZH3_9GLOM|nr:17448_t:CDS:2 [Acaulospora morrowiae]